MVAFTPAKSDSQVSTGSGDLTGSYAFTLHTGQQQLAGQFVINRTNGRYTGTIGPAGAPPVAIDSIQVQGRTLTLAFVVPSGGPATMELTPAGADSLTGKFTGPPAPADVSAHRVH
jgi:hypothetical protein